MASSAKYSKYDSAVDDIISIVKRYHFGKPVDDEFLSDLKSFIKTKLIASEYVGIHPKKTIHSLQKHKKWTEL